MVQITRIETKQVGRGYSPLKTEPLQTSNVSSIHALRRRIYYMIWPQMKTRPSTFDSSPKTDTGGSHLISTSHLLGQNNRSSMQSSPGQWDCSPSSRLFPSHLSSVRTPLSFRRRPSGYEFEVSIPIPIRQNEGPIVILLVKQPSRATILIPRREDIAGEHASRCPRALGDLRFPTTGALNLVGLHYLWVHLAMSVGGYV